MKNNLPGIRLGGKLNSSWGNKVNETITSNQLESSEDFVITRTGKNSRIHLHRKHKIDRADVLVWRGEWDADTYYNVNDVVRVLPGVEYIDNTSTVIDATPGVWRCSYGVPDKNYSDSLNSNLATLIANGLPAATINTYLRIDGIDYFPKLPEPSDLPTVDNADGRYWEIISPLCGQIQEE